MNKRCKELRARRTAHARGGKASARRPKRQSDQDPAGYCRRLYEIPRIGRLYPIDEE